MSSPAPSAEALFDRLYHEHAAALHAYLFGRTGDPEAARDLLQEACLRAWRHLPTVRALPPERQRYWLFGVARNLVTDYYRRRAIRVAAEAPLDDQSARAVAAPGEAVTQVEEAEQLRQLDQAITRLPEELRTVLLLQVLGGLSSRQIGDILGLPAGTVRYKIAQARKQLAAALRLIDEPMHQGGTA